MSVAQASLIKLSSIADTMSGVQARENPQNTIAHYERLADQLWLPPEVRDVAERTFKTIEQGRTAWASLSGAYGFGKTAATITLWDYARSKQFLAIPPLSCTNFDELAHGIAALAEVQIPKAQKKIRALFKEVWTEGLDTVARNDAERYEMAPMQLRQLLEDKLESGHLTLDNQCYRLVEFLSRLGELATQWSNGLIVILDELQQLLGPLDVRAIVKFREFVWGMRTERSHCGVVLALDSLLEARLARWATDVLHRIRDHGPSLQMSLIYTREFPTWLWGKLSTKNGSAMPTLDPQTLTDDILLSLGQFVERPDLSNGPRTVVDVFSRAQLHYQETGSSYDIPNLVHDIHQGNFRYFGEGAPVQTVLAQLFKDEWLTEDETRLKMVRTLAAFPLGCPQEVLQKHIPSKKKREQARAALFGPLLVELSSGLALEKLQQVQRSSMDWEQLLAQCWETLPALDALAAHAPNMVLRVLIPVLFPQGNPANPTWENLSDDSTSALTGWHLFRGSFHDAFPKRDIAVSIANEEPKAWRKDVDLCIAFVCDSASDSVPLATTHLNDDTPCITLHLPVLKPIYGTLPADLARCHKYIQPEPFRPITILTAIHDLEAFLGPLLESEQDATPSEVDEHKGRRHARAFVKFAVDFVLREMLQGVVEIDNKRSINQRGPELIQALFTVACRHRFPKYETFTKAPKWQEVLETYRNGIRSDNLSLAQRQGREFINGPKAELLNNLFDQKSTAAGDSFLRVLGPMIENAGAPEAFSIRLALHPSEVAVLTYLKATKSKQRIPFTAAAEFLRHQGYIDVEAAEVIKLLTERELVTVDESRSIEVVQNSDVAREMIVKRIAEIQRELVLLGDQSLTKDVFEKFPLSKLRKRLDELEKRLGFQLQRQIDEVKGNVDKIRQLIGLVIGTTIKDEYVDSEIQRHLSGIAGELLKNKDEIIKTLRKELQRAEADVRSAQQDSEQWVKLWSRRRAPLSANLQKLEERVALFIKRAGAIAHWPALNQQLRSVSLLCEKVKHSDPGASQMLSHLINSWKERFATDSWNAVFSAADFSSHLLEVQSQVQTLLYRYLQTFNQELETLKREFKKFLPSSLPPTFDMLNGSKETTRLIDEAFQNLYSWAFEGFKDKIKVCRRRKQLGAQWVDQTSRHMSWKDLDKQVENASHAFALKLEFKELVDLGNKILRMDAGFTRSQPLLESEFNIVSYSDPAQPPNFTKLEKLFQQGRITIKVETRDV